MVPSPTEGPVAQIRQRNKLSKTLANEHGIHKNIINGIKRPHASIVKSFLGILQLGFFLKQFIVN